MNDVIRTIKERRSVRAYTDEVLSREDVETIIDAGICAPTGHNCQPWHFTVIMNKALLDRINKKTSEVMAGSEDDWVHRTGSNPDFRVTYDAPVLIIVSGRKDSYDYAADCSAAIENMILAAESIGIGSVWLGLVRFFFTLEDEMKALNIPEGYEPFYGVAFGYASKIRQRPAQRETPTSWTISNKTEEVV